MRRAPLILLAASPLLAFAQEIPADAPASSQVIDPAAAPTEAATPDMPTPVAPESAATDSSAAPLETIPLSQPAETATPASTPSGSRMVEEIIVTAQKREENIQDVPIAISAFSADRLDASGIQSTNDLPAITPGLNITYSAGYSLIYLRGIGTSAFIPSFDPSIATYVDGIYIPSQQGTLTDLGGVERVEVLKGPQGTLFGRNSTGGAINVVTKNPGATPELSLSAEAGSFNAQKYKAYGSYPVTDTLSIAVAGIYQRRDSYYDVVTDPLSPSVAPNYSLDPEITGGGRIKLRWTPLDDLEVILAAYRVVSHGSQGLGEINTKPSPILGALINPPGDYNTSANIEPHTRQHTSALYGISTYSTALADVKLFAAYQDQNADGNIYDFDGSQLNIAIFNGPNQPSKLKTAELQFLSNDEGWTPEWLKWIGGIYYLTQEAGYDPFFATVGDVVGLIPYIQLPEALNVDFGNGPVNLGASGILETNSYSGFAQGTATFTDWLSLTLGGRYQKENRYLTKQQTFAQVVGSAEITTLQFNQPRRHQKNFSPKATLELRPTQDVMAYLTWARGFKSGSYNIVTLYTIPDYVKPERVTTTEVGIKTTIIPGLTFNAAAFNNEIRDLQETKLSLLSGGAIAAENAPAARTRGAEFDAVWMPFINLAPGFVITSGLTYVDAKYTDYPDASGFDDATGLPFGKGAPLNGRDFSGNRIARTPELSGFLGLSQTIDTSGGPLEVAADIRYSGDYYFSAQNTENSHQDAYSVIGLRASYLYEHFGLRFTGFVRNLTDKRYVDTSITVDFGVLERLAMPRTYGFSIAYDL